MAHIVNGYKSNFEQITIINSYREEVYASLATTLFLCLYSTYYNFPDHNKINALCDNHAYVSILTCRLEDDYYQQDLYKNAEAEAISIIFQFLPSKFTIEHIKGHQDDTKMHNALDIKTHLNIDTDK